MAKHSSLAHSSKDGSNHSQDLDKLTREITCLVCKELIKEPNILPCLYCSFKAYPRSLAQRGQLKVQNWLSCPNCHSKCHLSTKDAVSPVGIQQKKDKSEKPSITECKSTTKQYAKTQATTFHANSGNISAKKSPSQVKESDKLHVTTELAGQHCAQLMSESSIGTHQLVPLSKDKTKKDLSGSVNKQLPKSKSGQKRCSEHFKELNLFCLNCQKLLCQKCTDNKHKGHRYEFTKKMPSKFREEMNEKLQLLTLDQAALMTEIQRLTQVKTDTRNNAKECSDFVNHAIDEMVKLYETCRNELLQQIEIKSQEKLSQLSAAEKNLTNLNTELQNLVSFIRNALDFGTDLDQGIPLIDDQLLYEIDQHHEECAHFDVEGHVGQVSISREECVATIANVASTCIAADPDKCSLEIDSARVGKPVKMKLHLKTLSDQPCYAKQLLDIEIKPLKSYHEFSCEANIAETTPGVVQVSYTPKVRGRHVVSVSVNRNPIASSPFPFRVKPLMTQMLTPTKVIPMADTLGDMAVTESGDLLITLPKKGTIVKLDMESMQRKVVGSGFDHPMGIAISKNDDVYITEGQVHCVRKLNQNFLPEGTVGQLGTTTGCFNIPGALTVNYRGEVIVCDQLNSRVQIFNSKLKFQRWYGVARPLGVACGKRDEIFVTESTKNRVCKIYDKSLGLQEFCKNLISPKGVFVNEDHVYVTEEDQIAVYKVSGQYVGSLGNTVLKKVHQITGDDDGFLYVYDNEAEMIFVF